MAYKNDKNMILARELREQGKTVKSIAEITGLSEKTIYNYTSGCVRKPIKEENLNTKMDYDMRVRWTNYVNRIRRYYGKKPFPMPLPEVKT